MTKETLAYDSRDGRYHGVQSDGAVIQIDADAFSEAVQQRVTDSFLYPDTYGRYSEAFCATADPDGWSEDMAGWLY